MTLRVAILSATPLPLHGWGSYTRDLIVGLAVQDIAITLITSVDSPTTTDLPVVGYHRVLPSLTPAPRLSSIRLLLARYAAEPLLRDCDVVHVTAEPYAICCRANKPLIVTAHGTYLPRTLAGRLQKLYRRTYLAATILCVSSYTQRQVQAALRGVKSVVIPNGVNIERFAHVPDRAQHSLAPIILAVGQLKARKGQHILVQAMKQIRTAVPDARAVLVGDTSDANYLATIKTIIEREKLDDAVQITGRVSNSELMRWYAEAQVFALPALNTADGKFEGFGLVYLEANAAGLPVIGTVDCGAEDAILEGETGYLIPQNDPNALATSVIGLLRNPQRRAEMGTAGRLWAAANTWLNAAKRVRDLYNVMVEASHANRHPQ